MERILRRLAALAAAFPGLALAQQPIVLEGEVPDDPAEHFTLPFEVPEGTVEIEVAHDDLSQANILDWGLYDTMGFRGWGGGNSENAIVGLQAASRSYLPGPMQAGVWAVTVGKAKLVELPARYRVEITLRTAPTLAPQTERRPYEPVPALKAEARWYAGDFHVHSRESGDARPPLDQIADFAQTRALDFVELSDHNTTSQLELVLDAQARHPDLLFLPGVEFTTYHGHANGIGATGFVDHKINAGVTIEDASTEFHAQGALFSINHPVLDLGNLCLGCSWTYDVSPELVDAVEIATGGWSQTGYIFGQQAMEFWEALCAQGFHIQAIGGSDDHRGGEPSDNFHSPIGDPTTMVFATELSTGAIVQGIRDGRTVVKLQGPDDPMIDLAWDVPREGDTLLGERATLTATVTGGSGAELRFVQDGEYFVGTPVGADPFTSSLAVTAPAAGETRIRAEVWVAGAPRTVTSHVWLKLPPPEPAGNGGSAGSGAAGGGAASEGDGDGGGCGCAASRGGMAALGLSLVLALVARRPGRRCVIPARPSVGSPAGQRAREGDDMELQKLLVLGLSIATLGVAATAQAAPKFMPKTTGNAPEVRLIKAEQGKTVQATGKLEEGKKIDDLSWASTSSMACFPATQNEKFRGNHVFFATDLPGGGRREMTIKVIPKDATQDVSIYGYQVGTTTTTLPPAISSAVSCEAEHKWDRPKRGKTQDHTREIWFNTVQHPYHIIIGVSGPASATKGDFTLEVTLKP